MRSRLIALASAGLLCAVAPHEAGAQGQAARMRFEAMDSNRDGVISRSEWQGSDRSFQVHDWNGDGRLSGEEVAIGARRNSSWEQADHQAGRYEQNVTWTPAGFSNLDHNRDGRITSNEWHFDLDTFRRVDRNRDGALDRAEFLGENWDDDRGDNFDDIDYNNNGFVERSEWHGSVAAFNALDRNGDGRLSRFEGVGGVDTTGDTWDEFASLDYNRNGAISVDEWHWSRAAFDRRDQNRDGVISRREFDLGTGAPGPSSTTPVASRSVRVNPATRWTSSGLNVRAGDTIRVTANGTIQMSDNAQDTATPAGSSSGRRADNAPVLNQPAGMLLAMIDNYGPIVVGDQRTFRAPVTGRLYFGVNDDHLPDNQGSYTVNVEVGGS